MADPDETKTELVPARDPVQYDLLGKSDGDFDRAARGVPRPEPSRRLKPAAVIVAIAAGFLAFAVYNSRDNNDRLVGDYCS